jgi:Flp pilus assembly protein TadG
MSTKHQSHKRPHSRRGQAILETALGGLFLAMLLAGAVDLGRAYYAAIVVENMAGEGASYAAKYPERDAASPLCSQTGVLPNQNIQDRARRVAADRGIMIRQPGQANIEVDPPLCVNRCSGTPIRVTVTYQINDLLLPGLLGFNSITIKNSATQYVLDNVSRGVCGTP